MISKFLGLVIGVNVVLIFLYSSFIFWTSNENLYKVNFEANRASEVIGISEDELFIVNNVIIDYIFNKRDDIIVIVDSYSDEPFFTERETMHMEDVKVLFTYGKYLFIGSVISLIICIIICIIIAIRKKILYKSFKFSVFPVLITLIAICLVSVLATMDFSKYFESFHLIFFDNDLWILDPKVDMMINMYTLDFFIDIASKIIISFISLLVIYGICFTNIRKKKSTK